MGTSAWLATQGDEFALAKIIADARLPLTALPLRPGDEVARELGGRLLYRYLSVDQAHEPWSNQREGIVTFVTPTPYAPQDLCHWLDLPAPDKLRTHVVRLDPAKIDWIQGPQWVGLGMGLQ